MTNDENIKLTVPVLIPRCWITNKYIHYIVNVGYYSVVFIFTSVIFIKIIQKIIQAKQSVVKTSSKKAGAIFGLYVLLGLTWGVAFFSYGAMTVPSYYIFTILNSFQGRRHFPPFPHAAVTHLHSGSSRNIYMGRFYTDLDGKEL